MTVDTIIYTVKRELISAFALLDEWFDKDHGLMQFKPPKGWNVPEVLEHVMLTSHYLLILIDKGSGKALRQAAQQVIQVPEEYILADERLHAVGDHDAFAWERPDHMNPTGTRPLSELRSELRDQLDRCLVHLELLKNGEGLLYQTTMSVNELGKLDVYQYLYFLAKHIRRHVTQLQKIEEAFNLELSM